MHFRGLNFLVSGLFLIGEGEEEAGGGGTGPVLETGETKSYAKRRGQEVASLEDGCGAHWSVPEQLTP